MSITTSLLQHASSSQATTTGDDIANNDLIENNPTTAGQPDRDNNDEEYEPRTPAAPLPQDSSSQTSEDESDDFNNFSSNQIQNNPATDGDNNQASLTVEEAPPENENPMTETAGEQDQDVILTPDGAPTLTFTETDPALWPNHITNVQRVDIVRRGLGQLEDINWP